MLNTTDLIFWPYCVLVNLLIALLSFIIYTTGNIMLSIMVNIYTTRVNQIFCLKQATYFHDTILQLIGKP